MVQTSLIAIFLPKWLRDFYLVAHNPRQQVRQPVSRQNYPPVSNPARTDNVSRRKHRSRRYHRAVLVPIPRRTNEFTVKVGKLGRNLEALFTWRSRIVHGMRLHSLSPEKSGEVMYEAEGFARKSLLKILASSGLINSFTGKDREKFLDDLIYSAP